MTDPLERPSPYDRASAPPPPPPPYEWSGPPSFLSNPVPAAPPRRQSNRLRWAVALLATLVVVVAGIGVAVFAQSSRSTASIGPTFLPASAEMFVDARLDLPGAQREKLTAFLAHFPGFADQANFDVKVDELFNRWVGDATQGKLTYTGSIKPWFSGQIAVGVLQLPLPSSGTIAPMLGNLPTGDVGVSALDSFHAVVGFGVKDRSRLDATLGSVRSLAGVAAGATFTDEDYNGTTLVTVAMSSTTWTYAVTDTVFLVSTNATDLKQSIDLLAAPAGSLAKDASFSQKIAQLPADRLGTMYLGSSYFASLSTLAQGTSNPFAGCGNVNALANLSEVGALVVQGDNVSIDFRVSSGTPGMGLTGTDDLAGWMPADTEAYLAVPGIGKSAHDLIACLKPQITAMLSAAQLQQVETTLGAKLEDYLSFVGDVAVGASYDGTKVHAGLVANLTDETVATTRVHDLIALIRVGGSAGGLPITITDSKVGDVTVTTIDFSKMPSGAVPLPVDTSISVAVGNGHFFLGMGDFATAAVSRQKADSLAGTARYASTVPATGSGGWTALYIDIAALKSDIEAAGHADGNYTTNIKPYLDPLDRVALTYTPADDGESVRVGLFVK
jgi:hypothetical protein